MIKELGYLIISICIVVILYSIIWLWDIWRIWGKTK